MIKEELDKKIEGDFEKELLNSFEKIDGLMKSMLKKAASMKATENCITNEQIIAFFPSKAVREYLKKINW